jgi:hypothetical protein
LSNGRGFFYGVPPAGLPPASVNQSGGGGTLRSRDHERYARDRRFWNRTHQKTFQSTAWRKWRSAGHRFPTRSTSVFGTRGGPGGSAQREPRRSGAKDLCPVSNPQGGNVGGETTSALYMILGVLRSPRLPRGKSCKRARSSVPLLSSAARSACSIVLLPTAARRHRVVSPKNPGRGQPARALSLGRQCIEAATLPPLWLPIRRPPRRHATLFWKRKTGHAVPPPEPGTIRIVKTASFPRLSRPRSEGRGFALPQR